MTKLLLPPYAAGNLINDQARNDAVDTISSFIHFTMGRAIAAVLMGKEKALITRDEALASYNKLAEMPEENELRNRAIRAGWSAVAYNQHLKKLFPPLPLMALGRAFGALDAGSTVGIATAVKNSRRAGAHDYDGLAKLLAIEVTYRQAMFDLDHVSDALMLVTGVKNPDSRKFPVEEDASLPMPCRTWEQVKNMLKRGQELVGQVQINSWRELGWAVSAGLASDVETQLPEIALLREIFADPKTRDEAIQRAFATAPTGRKPRVRTTAPKTHRRKSATRRGK